LTCTRRTSVGPVAMTSNNPSETPALVQM